MQAVTHIGPATGVATTVAFVTSLVGVVAPIVYFAGFLVVLTVGVGVTELAKNFPSAGGYFTYVSRTIHARAGLLTAWISFLVWPLAGTISLGYLGYIVSAFFESNYDVAVPWWAIFLVAAGIVTAFLMRGAKVSARAMVTLGCLEIGIVLAIAIGGLINPGPGGTNLSSFNPANASSGHGLYLAIVFTILAFSGFESVAPLAEESVNPRRNLPIAVIGSIFAMGAFYVIASWGIVTAFGVDSVHALAATEENPLLQVASSLVGGAQWIALFAIINSGLAVAIAAANASTRMFFAMGRSGVMPSALAAVSARRRTPINAIRLQATITVLYGLGVGLWIGPDQELYMTGVVITLGLIFVYSAGNVGVIRYFLTERRSHFRFFLHGVVPVISTAALVWVGYKSVVPLPTGPVAWSPFVFAAWVLVGVLLVWRMSRTGREAWLVHAGKTMFETDGVDASEPELSGSGLRPVQDR
ncbi:amino acid transporter [Marmoricola sp. URHA0025 HA25]